ncbi:MAG: tetratricopeptide repeat protein [Vampirovibrionales bacterium]
MLFNVRYTIRLACRLALLLGVITTTVPTAGAFELPHHPSANALPRTGYAAVDARMNELLHDGTGTKALALLQALIQKQPDNWQAKVAMANVYRRQQQYPQARILLEQAQAVAPQALEVWVEWVLLSLVDTQLPPTVQEQALSQLRTLYPNDAYTALCHGWVALRVRNDVSTALSYARQALQSESNQVQALCLASQLLGQLGDVQQARLLLLKAYDLAPNSPIVLDALATYLGQQQQFQQSITFAQKANVYDLSMPVERATLLANNYQALGDAAQALRYWQEVNTLTPNRPEVVLRIAQLLEQTQPNQPKAIIVAYRQALVHNPQLLETWLATAQAQLEERQLPQAQQTFQKVLALDASHVRALQGLVQILIIRSKDERFSKPTDAELLQVEQALWQVQQQRTHARDETTLAFKATYPPEQCTLDRAVLVWLKAPNDEANTAVLRTLATQSLDPFIQVQAAVLIEDFAIAREALASASPKTPTALLQLGDRLHSLGYNELALNAYRQAYQQSPSVKQRPMILALEENQQRLQASIDNVDALLQRPTVANRQQAKGILNRALALDATHPQVYLRYAQLAYHGHLYTDAERYLGLAFGLDPSLKSQAQWATWAERIHAKTKRY